MRTTQKNKSKPTSKPNANNHGALGEDAFAYALLHLVSQLDPVDLELEQVVGLAGHVHCRQRLEEDLPPLLFHQLLHKTHTCQ
jgi:hypothetical protein